ASTAAQGVSVPRLVMMALKPSRTPTPTAGRLESDPSVGPVTIPIYRAGRLSTTMHPAERLRGTRRLNVQGKSIVLGVTGSIAAVETVKLAHELIRHGAEVYAVLSRSAAEIIHPNALQYATGHPVVTAITGAMEYLEMCGRDGKADLLLIAPCTSNTIGKIAHGIDDTTVTTYAVNALGSGIPVLVAPAAHESMMDNPAVVANFRRLKEIGVELIDPRREEDKAKMADIETIAASAIRRLGTRDLAEKVDADVCVVPAAVADFPPAKKAKGKISSREGGLTLDLEPTPKILDRFRRGTRKVLVGFKAEAGVTSAELKARAMALVKEADLDLVVANDISKVKGDTTSVTIFDRKGESDAFEGSKALAAERVWRAVLHGVRE